METPFFVKSFLCTLSGFVKIDNIPLLTSASVVAINFYWGTFTVIATLDIKSFTGLPIDELVILVLEYLPPVRVGAPDSHLTSTSVVSDVPRLVVQSSLDS